LAAEAFQGWSIGAYNVCTKPAGGSYSCENVGNVTSYTKSGLSNGTTYTFKAQALNAYSYELADSNELSATPESTGEPEEPVGGGGWVIETPTLSNVILEGFAYPSATVHILRDAQKVGTINVGGSATFSYSDPDVSNGNYKYSLFAVDKTGRRSATTSIFVTVSGDGVTVIDSIVLPPTMFIDSEDLSFDKASGRNPTIRGFAFPGSHVVVEVIQTGATLSTIVLSNGSYTLSLDISGFSGGVYALRSRTLLPNGMASTYSSLVGFGVDVPFKKKVFDIPKCGLLDHPDLNCDGDVNIIDVSILMFWFKKAVGQTLGVDFNFDGMVDIIDFSILVFYWTG
jgi:hypothetical protein